MASQLAGDGSFVANLAVSAFRCVSLSSNRGITYSLTGTVPVGVTLADTASGDFVAVKFFTGPGTHKSEVTGVPVTVGDLLYAADLGRVGTTGTVSVGRSLTTATSNGSVIEFIPLR